MALHRKTGNADAIRRQAELLGAARHPGVVELIGLEGSSERPVLVTALVDGPTLAGPMVFTVEEVAGLARELATTLADLHELGIVHGAVAPEHVLVDADGRPVLCGFASAGRAGEAGPADDQELHPANDVAALGRLLRRLATGPDARSLRRIAEAATADDPATRPSAREVASEVATAVPGARLPIRPADAVPGGVPVRDLRSLVAGARPDRGRRGIGRRRPPPTVGAEFPSEVTRPRRPAAGLPGPAAPGGAGTAGLLGIDVDGRGDGSLEVPLDHTAGAGGGRAHAGHVGEEVGGPGEGPPDTDVGLDRPGSGAPGHDRPSGLPASGRRRPPVRAAALVGAVGSLVAVGVVVRAPWASPSQTRRDPVATSTMPPSRPSVVPPTVAATSITRPSVRPDCQAPTSVLVADIDGDGCLDALRYADGVLEADGLRWALGQAGDQLATGDWSCRGTRTVVLLRPSTGQVFRFESWAVGSHDSVTGSAVAMVPGGQAVRAADVDRDGCHELVVERGELPPQVIRLPRQRP